MEIHIHEATRRRRREGRGGGGGRKRRREEEEEEVTIIHSYKDISFLQGMCFPWSPTEVNLRPDLVLMFSDFDDHIRVHLEST